MWKSNSTTIYYINEFLCNKNGFQYIFKIRKKYIERVGGEKLNKRNIKHSIINH